MTPSAPSPGVFDDVGMSAASRDADAEAAFEAFVRARTPSLLRTAYLLTGDADRAEDLLQTALIKVAQHWERIEHHPEAYARRVLTTQQISWWRARQRRVAERPLEERHDRSGPGTDPDLRLGLAEALAQLTPKQRAVVVLRYAEDLTEPQVADLLGIRPGTVKSVARQAVARLRTLAPHLEPGLDPDHDRELEGTR